MRLKKKYIGAIILGIMGSAPFVQADFYVIPVGKKGANVINVKKTGGDYTTLYDAIANINDASAEKPYLILVGPGTFNQGNLRLVMKPYVSIMGSGPDATFITGNVSDSTGLATPVELIAGAQGTTLSSLRVVNLATQNSVSAGIRYLDANGSIENVVVENNSTVGGMDGIIVQNGVVSLENVRVDVNGDLASSYATAIKLRQGARVEGRGVTASSRSFSDVIGIHAMDTSTLHLYDASVSATAGAGDYDSYGIFITTDSDMVMTGTQVQISGSTNYNTGVLVDQGGRVLIQDSNIYASTGSRSIAVTMYGTTNAVINNSYLSGTDAVLNMSYGYADMINSQLGGRVTGYTSCTRCVDPDDNNLSSDCKSVVTP